MGSTKTLLEYKQGWPRLHANRASICFNLKPPLSVSTARHMALLNAESFILVLQGRCQVMHLQRPTSGTRGAANANAGALEYGRGEWFQRLRGPQLMANGWEAGEHGKQRRIDLAMRWKLVRMANHGKTTQTVHRKPPLVRMAHSKFEPREPELGGGFVQVRCSLTWKIQCKSAPEPHGMLFGFRSSLLPFQDLHPQIALFNKNNARKHLPVIP